MNLQPCLCLCEQQQQHIVPGCFTVYGCPLAYEVFASNKIQFRGAIRHGNRFSLFSRIDQTNEHHFKLMTVCLNSVLHDLDGKAFRVAKVGFTFSHFRQSQRWYFDQLFLYSKTNEPIIFSLHDYVVGFIYRSRENEEPVNNNTAKDINLSRIQRPSNGKYTFCTLYFDKSSNCSALFRSSIFNYCLNKRSGLSREIKYILLYCCREHSSVYLVYAMFPCALRTVVFGY